MSRSIDVLIIGGGPGGYIAALRLAQLGRSALVVEREQLGGECLNRGCIPSKSLIHASQLYEELQRTGAEIGVRPESVRLDIPAMQQWKEEVLSKERNGVAMLFKSMGVEWIHGTARLTGPRSATVEAQEGAGGPQDLEFQACILATGAYHLSLPGIEPDGARVLTAREMLTLRSVPARLVILGGGVSGVELGQHYARLGSKVTIVELLPQIVPGTEADLARELRKALEQAGVEIWTGSKATRLEKTDSQVVLHAETPQGPRDFPGDVLFLTVGKRPETRNLGLELAGVHLTERGGFIQVDDRMATNVPGIFAVGDVARPPMLAHKAYREGILAAEVIVGLPSRWNHQVIPGVIYTAPELASVGLTLEAAREKGIAAREVRFPYLALGRAHASHATQGFVKMVAEEGTGLVLGLHAAGERSGEFVSEAALAIEMGATVRDIAATIHPHPTFGELMSETALLWLGEPMHVARPSHRERPRP